MKLLVDTNVFLEILLDQVRADEARELLLKVDRHDFFISDFGLHSIGLLLLRLRQPETFRRFLLDMVVNAGLMQRSLFPSELNEVINAAMNFELDFDDAYQYAFAERYGLTIASFDADFDRTSLGRILPGAAA